MNPFTRLRMLLAPEDAPPGGAAPAEKPAAAAAPPAGEKPTEKKPDAAPAAPERKSILAAQPDAAEAKPGEKPKSEEKAPEGKKPDPNAPYEVKLPEGMKADDPALKSFTDRMKGKGVSAEHASEALAYFHEYQVAERERWAKQDQDWYGELEKDSEFGGAKLKESSAALQKALKRFDTDGSLAKDLGKYGLENLPSLAKFLRRIGLAAGEDNATVPRTDPKTKAPPEKERLAKLYPSLAKELVGDAG